MLDFLLHKRRQEWATQVSLFYAFGAVSSKQAGLVITEKGDKSTHRNTSLGKPVESYTSLRIQAVFSRLQLYWLIVGEMCFFEHTTSSLRQMWGYLRTKLVIEQYHNHLHGSQVGVYSRRCHLFSWCEAFSSNRSCFLSFIWYSLTFSCRCIKLVMCKGPKEPKPKM